MHTLPKIIARTSLPTLRHSSNLRSTLTKSIRYGFARKFDRQELISQLDKDIEEYKSITRNSDKHEQYFQ